MTGYCKDCKWWESGESRAWGVCEGVDEVHADSPGDHASIGRGDALVVMAGDYYGAVAALRTGPMFGCTLFQSREKN